MTVRYLNIAVFAALAVVLLRQARGQGGPPARWAGLSFVSIALIPAQSILRREAAVQEALGAVGVLWLRKGAIAAAVLFPYFLYRFAASFGPRSRWLDRLALALAGLAGAATLALPQLPGPGQERPGLLWLYVALVLTEWTTLSGVATVRLWRAGRSQPTLARRRARLMSLASGALNVGVLGAAASPAGRQAVASMLLQLMLLASAGLFFLGFATPRWLRVIWRHDAEQQLQRSAARLVAATTVSEVTDAVLPQVAGIVGGRAAALSAGDGAVVASYGLSAEQASSLTSSAEGTDDAYGETQLTFPLDLWHGALLVWTSPYTPFFGRDEAGVLRRVGALADLALARCELIERERAAQESIRQQAELLDLAQDSVIVLDLDHRIRYWNRGAEEHYGWHRDEVLGQISHELLQTRFPAPVSDIQADLLRVGYWEGELVQARRDRSKVVVASRWALKRDAAGQPAAMLEINNDITARKAAEETALRAIQQAEEANRAKSEFLSRVSHELRTPMAAILGFAQLLELDLDDGQQLESVRHILKAGRHLLGLIDEVLDIARIESGRLSVSLEPVAITEIVNETRDMVGPLAAERGVGLQFEAVTCGWHVQADRQRLKQVLLNLLSNAVKYGPEGGMVTVTCGLAADGHAHLDVHNEGPGIPAAQLHRLFRPFDRLEAAHSGVEGVGLGLALSKHMVEAMDGRIGVTSTVGAGSTFWVELRLAEEDLARMERSLEELPAAVHDGPSTTTDGAACTVLFIEDNPASLRLLERIMARRPQCVVLTAMQGTQGAQLARTHVPDLIFLDLDLPDVPGAEVLRRLHEDPRTSHIPVVVVSADATSRQIERLLSAGARDYLVKPVDVLRLLATVDDVIEQKADGTR